MSNPSCWSGCCAKIREETRVHCREFNLLGMSNVTCEAWIQDVGVTCDSNPCSCSSMGKVLYTNCLALTKDAIANPFTRQRMCQNSRVKFEKTRCVSSCQFDVLKCYTDHGDACATECSDFQKCECFATDGISACDGSTIIQSDQSFNVTLRRCTEMPSKCRWDNEANDCIRLRWCPLDMCLLRNTQCIPDPATQTCVRYGACSPYDGNCHWVQKDDGTECDDGSEFTYPDVCLSGKCVGRRDQCMGLAVECIATNPCLVSPGFCSSVGDLCIYDMQPDGTRCKSNDDLASGTCVRGICVQPPMNMCADSCDDITPMCHLGSTCDPSTGFCDYQPLPDGTSCDDYNLHTVRDTCVEGLCIGSDYASPEFRRVFPDGAGCTDSKQRVMKYYQADDMLLSECKDYCAHDGSCSAIAHSLFAHSCKMYSNLRQRPVEGWIFVENSAESSSMRGPISHAIASKRDGDPTYSCYVKVGPGEGDRFEGATDPNVKAIIFFSCAFLVTLFLWWLARRRRRRKESKRSAAECENTFDGASIYATSTIPDEFASYFDTPRTKYLEKSSDTRRGSHLPPLRAKLPPLSIEDNADGDVQHTASFMTEPVELN